MMKKYIVPLISVMVATAAAGDDYTKGIFIVNEDWYGHQNSTVNYLLPDESDEDCWHYRAFQEANDGCQLGATNQFATIYDGRFYFIAKQPQDPGSSVAGGRITVADAKSLRMLYQSPVIDPTGAVCDGRSFVGVNPHKGYVSSSNGIWVMDLDTYAITAQIPGTENPNVSASSDRTDPMGILYHGQTGTMVSSNGKIFAAHQQYGCLVIDPLTDTVIDSINPSSLIPEAGIGSIVEARDGSLWMSLSADVTGSGSILPYLLRVDPSTLETQLVPVPDEFQAPANSWYAWTPDSFCGSSVTNSLYWSCSSGRWFASQNIYRYNIDTKEWSKIIDLSQDGEDWKVYGCSMRLHPLTDELYVSLYKDNASQVYITRRYTPQGQKIRDYQMVRNYWFPSIPVFPASANDNITDLAQSEPSIICHGKTLRVEGLKGCTLRLYSIQGSLEQELDITDDACELSPHVTPGIYVAHTPPLSKKIVIN